MKSLAALRTTLDAVEQAVQDGNYALAQERLNAKPPGELDRGLAAWQEVIAQEITERQTPEVDLRAYVLEGMDVLRAYHRATGTTELALRLAQHVADRRFSWKALQPVLEALVADGTLLRRRGRLWYPEDWAAAVQRNRGTRRKKAEAT